MTENNTKLKSEIKSEEVKLILKKIEYKKSRIFFQNLVSEKSMECEQKKETIGVLSSKISRCGEINLFFSLKAIFFRLERELKKEINREDVSYLSYLFP